jgi:hypothetical protein
MARQEGERLDHVSSFPNRRCGWDCEG